jgi:hypothetical protein
MKTILNISLLTFLLIGLSSQCFAMMSITDVSNERAKELGVVIRSEMAGTNQVNVWVEFKKQGGLKNFSHAQLEIQDGKRLVLSTTMVTRPGPTPDSVLLYFSIDRATLSACIVTIVTDMDLGYQFKMKDFIELKTSR